jgi:RNA polymerase sigma-70 factor (ECF subfamily)
VPSDASRELFASAAGGDESARDELLQRHLAGLRAFVRVRIGPLLRTKESSSDIVHSVCRELLEDLSGFEYRDEAGFRHWLYRRAENKIVDRARYWMRDKRDMRRETRGESQEARLGELEELQDLFTPSRDAAAREELERVERAFAELPDDYRVVISLAKIVGLPHAEIAREMGRSEGAVRTLLSRALARLATLLE